MESCISKLLCSCAVNKHKYNKIIGSVMNIYYCLSEQRTVNLKTSRIVWARCKTGINIH